MLAELAMAIVLFMVAMTLVVKVLGWVAHQRRAGDRRELALMEVANLMEEITARKFEQVTPELGQRLLLSESARQRLPDAQLDLKIGRAEEQGSRELPAKRIAIQLRWRGSGGLWEAPVRLASWMYGRGKRL
jgi:hypothetical protein